MVSKYGLAFTKQAQKDTKKTPSSGMEELLEIISNNPFQDYPPYEKLIGDLDGAYSRRINIQHRLVYQVLEEEKTVKVLRM